MIILPGMRSGRSPFWVPPPAPPAPPLELGIMEHNGNRYSAWNTWSAIVLPIAGGASPVKSGDLLVAFLAIDSDGINQFTNITADTGWVMKGIRSRTNGGGAVMVKVCDGTETTPTSMAINGSAQAWGYEVFRIEGADPTTAVHGDTYLNWDSNSTNFTPNSITTTKSGCLHLTFCVGGWAAFTFTVPAPYTEEFDRAGNGGSGWTSFCGGSYIQPEAANQPAGNHVCSAGLNRSLLHHMAIAPWNAV